MSYESDITSNYFRKRENLIHCWNIDVLTLGRLITGLSAVLWQSRAISSICRFLSAENKYTSLTVKHAVSFVHNCKKNKLYIATTISSDIPLVHVDNLVKNDMQNGFKNPRSFDCNISCCNSGIFKRDRNI